jgi:uncharacterized protein YPO0396
MPPSQISNAVLLEKINNVLKEVGDMAGDIKCNANDFAKFANEYAGAHVKVVERADNAHSRINELNKRVDALDAAMKKLTDSIHPLIYTNKVLTWLAVGFGSSIIALIWAILTHSVELVAP